MMIPLLMVWLYFAMLASAMQWPDISSMLITFAVVGFVPVFMLYRLLIAKRRQPGGTEVSAQQSVHPRVSSVDQQDAGED